MAVSALSASSLLFAANAFAQSGPSGVHAQLQHDEEARRPDAALFDVDPIPSGLPARRWTERFGLSVGLDYNALYQWVSTSPGAREGAAGVARLYGTWAPFGAQTPDVSKLVFKVENRHRLGTSTTPQELGPAAGIAGLTAPTFSDAGTLLTNLFWHQRALGNRFEMAIGVVDVTDYVDVYGLVNPWTDFSNLAFGTDPTIPTPSQGLGGAIRWSFTPNLYALGGLADANGDPSDPANSFDSLINTREYFKHLELGWVGSWDRRYSDNIHATVWHVDARSQVSVDDGWGLAFSLSHVFAARWMPFLRAGAANGGGAIVERSVSVGLGYEVQSRNDYLAFGANWALPPSDPRGAEGRDQYTFELYYRFQVLPSLAITPDLQLVVQPALAPLESYLWVLGLRVRAAL